MSEKSRDVKHLFSHLGLDPAAYREIASNESKNKPVREWSLLSSLNTSAPNNESLPEVEMAPAPAPTPTSSEAERLPAAPIAPEENVSPQEVTEVLADPAAEAIHDLSQPMVDETVVVPQDSRLEERVEQALSAEPTNQQPEAPPVAAEPAVTVATSDNDGPADAREGGSWASLLAAHRTANRGAPEATPATSANQAPAQRAYRDNAALGNTVGSVHSGAEQPETTMAPTPPPAPPEQKKAEVLEPVAPTPVTPSTATQRASTPNVAGVQWPQMAKQAEPEKPVETQVASAPAAPEAGETKVIIEDGKPASLLSSAGDVEPANVAELPKSSEPVESAPAMPIPATSGPAETQSNLNRLSQLFEELDQTRAQASNSNTADSEETDAAGGGVVPPTIEESPVPEMPESSFFQKMVEQPSPAMPEPAANPASEFAKAIPVMPPATPAKDPGAGLVAEPAPPAAEAFAKIAQVAVEDESKGSESGTELDSFAKQFSSYYQNDGMRDYLESRGYKYEEPEPEPTGNPLFDTFQRLSKSS